MCSINGCVNFLNPYRVNAETVRAAGRTMERRASVFITIGWPSWIRPGVPSP